MDGLMSFAASVQKLLLKKDQEYGALKYLLSRATNENANNIDEIVRCVAEIVKKHEILPEHGDVGTVHSCVDCYKYLLLNTHFTVQERLAEDLVNGHMVDMWPPLSPYLFVQILWHLKLEDVLAESILYIPLDLCVEVLDTVNRCIEELEYERATRVTFRFILNIYKKCLLLHTTGTQTTNITNSTDNLVASFHTLLDLLSSDKIFQLSNLPRLEKCARYGVMLKKLICITKECIEFKTTGVFLEKNLEKLYKITFGREQYNKPENEFLKSVISTLDNELVTLLLDKIKEIDCDIYLGWAELDDEQKIMISLQRAIAIECHYFMEFMKNDEELSQNDDLKQCLQQLCTNPNSETSILTLHEIYHGISSGQTAGMKELMNRYKEWDWSTLNFFRVNMNLMKKEHFDVLLKYLNHVTAQSAFNHTEKVEMCKTVLCLLLLQKTSDIYDIIVKYVITYLDRNCLEILWKQNDFNHFMRYHLNLEQKMFLHTLLFFFMVNPKVMLNNVFKVLIGCPEYDNIGFSLNELLYLRPFLCIRKENDRTLLTVIFKEVCMENVRWDIKKFTDFVRNILEKKITNADDIINNVFIPYLMESPFHEYNIGCILNNVHWSISNCDKADLPLLFISIAKRMSTLRNCITILKDSSEELFTNMARIINHFLLCRSHKLSINDRRHVIDSITTFIEPLDKSCFAPLWHVPILNDITDIVHDYERKCFHIVRKLKFNSRTSLGVRTYISDMKLNREVFLRHIFMKSTYADYVKYSYELCRLFFFFFGWASEINGIDNVLRLTMETICLCFHYPGIAPSDTSIFLFRCIVHLYKMFLEPENSVDMVIDMQNSLIKNISSIEKTMNRTPYSSAYADLIKYITAPQDTPVTLEDILDDIENFTDDCMELHAEVRNEAIDNFTPSEEIAAMYRAHQFVCACLKVSGTESHQYINKMDRLLFPN